MTMANWETLTQLFYDNAWHATIEATAANPGVTVERGVTDDLDIKPGAASWRLLDPADTYRPSNAASPLYGKTGPYMRGAFATGPGGGVGGRVWFAGEAQTMTPGETDDHRADNGVTVRGNRWVDVKLSGPLGRVGRWRDPLSSPLRTQISRYASALRGYWPLEDGRYADQLTNLADALRPGQMAGTVRLGAGDGPAGSAPVIQMSASGLLTLPVAPMSTTGGWELAFAVKVTSATAGSSADVLMWRTTAGYTWRWRVSTTGYGLQVTDPGGVMVLDEGYQAGISNSVGQWIYTRLKVSPNGSAVKIEPSWYAEQADNFWGVTTSYTGQIGAPNMITVPGNAFTEGAAYGHVFVVAGTAIDLESYDFVSAFNGYAGEQTASRFARLCDSRGLPYLILGDTSTAREMGPQPVATFNDQLKEIRQTEAGLIFDLGSNIGVVLALADYLTTQAAAPVLDLVWPRDIAPPLDEVTDAADLFNLITVKNANGSSAVAELTAGRYGTADPPTGSGRLDKTVNVNVWRESELADIASWWLAYYTQPGPRFDTITIDLDAHPELLTAANTADIGMFIRITGRTPDPLLLMITSIRNKTNRKRHTVTYQVVPGGIFDVGVYDDPGSRYDSASTTLAAAATATAPTLQITTAAAGDTWDTTAVPYDWQIAGERVTVTAITAPAGTGPWTQTATVTRAVNGVRKPQSAGAQVSLADPVYYGM